MTIDVASWQGILVPLDGSPAALRAVPIGAAVAARMGLPVALITVVADPAAVPSGDEVLSAVADAVIADRRVVVDRSPAARIVAEATASGFGVCMSTHGRGRIGRALVGSVAADALRDLDGPLLVVGPACEPTNLAPLDWVTAFLDGSPDAEAIVPVTVQWATRVGAQRRLVSIVSSDATVFDLLEVSAAPRGAERLAYLEQLHDVDPASCSVVFAHHIADAILEELRSHPAVAALTTHRRSDLSRLILGGVAHRVLSGSPTPLLLAPER